VPRGRKDGGRVVAHRRDIRHKEADIIPQGQYDTIVVGAGPAGVMAAREAHERGTVLLIDSSTLPRDKSCGGMLNEYAQDFLSSETHMPRRIVLEPEHVHFRYWDWDRGIRKPT
jgi:ribulose 1,5-bisphosphate synthetase/thiazole synthase